MSLVYIDVKKDEIENTKYAHNFKKDAYSARISTPSNYIDLKDNKNHYLCCECPCKINSKLWNSSFDEIYSVLIEEALSLEMLSKIPSVKSGFKINAPKTFSMGKIGYNSYFKNFKKNMSMKFKNIVINPQLTQSKQEIIEIALDN